MKEVERETGWRAPSDWFEKQTSGLAAVDEKHQQQKEERGADEQQGLGKMEDQSGMRDIRRAIGIHVSLRIAHQVR